MWLIIYENGKVVNRIHNPSMYQLLSLDDVDYEYQPCVGNWDNYIKERV